MKLLTIIGNIGKDATIKENNGKKQLMFSVAVNDRYKDAEGNKVERTDWISVFTNQLTLAPYLLKGTKVFVQGNTTSRFYTDSERVQRVGTTINAQIIQLLSNKKEDGVTNTDGALPAGGAGGANPDDDDMPF